MCMYLPELSTKDKMWHKVNFSVEESWLEFRVSYS